MTFLVAGLDYVAVLVAAIVGFIIGMIWYSPPVFGNAWMRLSGVDKKKMEGMKKGMGGSMVAGFIATLVMSFVLANLIGFLGITTASNGIMTAFWVWLGFIATVMLGMVLWEGKPVKLYVLHVAHYLVVLAVMGALLATWSY